MSMLWIEEEHAAGVSLEKVTKEYPNGFKAVADLDLDIEDGEFLVMVGPSGSGKSRASRKASTQPSPPLG